MSYRFKLYGDSVEMGSVDMVGPMAGGYYAAYGLYVCSRHYFQGRDLYPGAGLEWLREGAMAGLGDAESWWAVLPD